jgi:hypothetical protein
MNVPVVIITHHGDNSIESETLNFTDAASMTSSAAYLEREENPHFQVPFWIILVGSICAILLICGLGLSLSH